MEWYKDFKDYVDWTLSTSKHKNKEQAITCSLLGLSGEGFEYLHELDMKELGDILWYVGHLFNRLGLNVEETLSKANRDYPMVELHPGNFHGHVSRLHELFKKVIRDNDFDIQQSPNKEEILTHLSWFVYFVQAEAELMFDKSINDIMSSNMGKLEDRKARGVIGGSGNER